MNVTAYGASTNFALWLDALLVGTFGVDINTAIYAEAILDGVLTAL
jgi:hypothetical protein